MGAAVNVLMGFLISRVNIHTLAVGSALITMIAAPLMATIDVDDTYWNAAFWAMLLSPVNPDGKNCNYPSIDSYLHFTVLFTASNLVISNAFPAEVQSLAGGVFNEVAQFGNSVGLAVTAAIAASVTEHSSAPSTEALMDGYRAAFWTIFTATALVVVISFVGFRKGGLVGAKEE
jgi:hypothetical protein